MRKLLTALLVIVMSLSSIGCGSVKRKFVRKKNADEKPRPVLNLNDEQYKDLYTPAYLYDEYFVYWQSAEGELLNLLNSSVTYSGFKSWKRQIATGKMTRANLVNMQDQLKSENKTLLDEPLKELDEVLAIIDSKTKSDTKLSRAMRKLDMHFRRVKKNYHPSKMKDAIREK